MDFDFLLQEDTESRFYLEMMERLRSSRGGSIVTLIVFVGAKAARQFERCKVALQKLKKDLWKNRQIDLQIKYLDQDEVKNISKWGPEELTDYMLTFDIHICLTHPHQGNVGKSEYWNVRNIYRHVDRWSYHLGFFSGKYCRCPVLTQNKGVYLEAAAEVCNMSLIIKIPKPGCAVTANDVSKINAFVALLGPRYNNKFCIKLSYVTHRTPKYAEGAEGILLSINQYMRQPMTSGYYPYVIIQPRIYSPEVKIACFNGKAQFKCSKPKGGGVNSFHGITDQELFAFAEKSIAVLKAKCPFFFMDQLVRVDIFFDSVRQCLVVNEFESLEAQVLCVHGTLEGVLQDRIENYWYLAGMELVNFHLWRELQRQESSTDMA